METKKGTTIQSLEIGITIIDLIAQQRKPLKFSDIQVLTKITKSNLYKYLTTLTQTGMLYRKKDTGEYILGSSLIRYGMVAVDQEDVIDRIIPFLQEINRKSSSTVLFSNWTHNGPMIIREINTNRGFNIGAQIGTFLPILSATGKLFVSFLDEEMTNKWKEEQCRSLSQKRVIQLEEEYQLIKKQKISFAREPLVSSVSSIAFPVFNYKKQLLGAVTVVGFSEQIPQNLEDELSQYLIFISQEINASFGYVEE